MNTGRTGLPRAGWRTAVSESESESWKERGVALRVFVYVFATHLFAGFVWLLFYVGEHAPK
ncbi:hypothetical protein HRW18_32430 [Streptomyces lunaelactis]|nr:hypothetical protein [Streptomyces lunaelactis]NUK27929.1 hypothetical protein [Streptomyces lunaelactis]NUK38948.1 hypothetical protein [Streptomyces lunaelactis]NUK46057.1 hypothetical protein [Streptomyces lunaelactis]NUK59016.1 hypothetical protein [Streptomyces lunaelactis]